MKGKLFQRKYLLIFFLMCLVFIHSLYRLSDKYHISDNILNHQGMNTDVVDYQLTAVNLVKGHGLTDHFIEDYGVYKIGLDKTTFNNMFYQFMYFRGRFLKGTDLYDWSPPGYPTFLALFYYLFGVEPLNVMKIQFILIALAASLMPLIGFLYWSEIGIVSGMASSILFINFYSTNPATILAESVYVFLFSIWILVFSVWDRSPRIIFTALLGILLGMTLLVKGSSIFIVLLFPIYLFFKFKNPGIAIKQAIVFVLCLGILIIPWSAYASIKSHRLVLLCSQVMPDLLDGNNEQSVLTGEFTPDWMMGNKDYLYKKLEKRNYSKIKMLTIFLTQNYRSIPELLMNKLRVGFNKVILVIFLMIAFYASVFCLNRIKGGQKAKVPVFPLIFFINILLITLIAYGRQIIVLPFIYSFLFPATYLPFYWVSFSLGRIFKSRRTPYAL